ncbi:MAG TPA: hypothetical protein DF637_07405 [Rikenellaceae bacterium]|jgi:hypothetical protein|nr:hypothetical protein [Rikenellaceae bacterium]HCV16142.1 hypothetical protein [Rikenellaceae bacterium]
MKKVLLTLVSLIMLAGVSLGQDFNSITGKVQDSATRRPLSFASIQLLSSNISNVTNSEGIFVLKIPVHITADSVQISYLGYKSRRISVKDFQKGELLIPMEQSVVTLKPITVRPQDATSIVKMAFARVGENYTAKSMQMTAFYREMIRKGSNYVSINEAVLDINKAPYNSYRADQIGIYKARGSYDMNRIDTLLVKYQGGANSALSLDIMKDLFLGTDLMLLDKIYTFTMAEPVTIDNKFFYVINFNENDNLPDIYFRGKLYIESESLAVGRVEFAMNVEGRPQANSYFIRKKPPTLKMDVISANYLVNYKEVAGMWHFDYSRTEVKFNAKWDKKWFRSVYTIGSEIAVTDMSHMERRIDPENRVRSRDIMSAKVNDFTDENFWEDYNIIEPDQSIENVIARIIRQLRKRDN